MVTQTMLIPTRAMLAAKIAAVPPGTRGDLGAIRRALAAESGADATCPVTTQKLIRSIAEETVAAHGKGASRPDLVPYWRVVDAGRPAAARLAGGVAFVTARLAEEA